MNKIVFLTVAVCLYCTLADAQMVSPSVIASAGDSYQNNYAYMDVTIGEVVTETMTGANYILTNGFQQGHYSVDFIQDEKLTTLHIDVFPNPARDFIIFSMQSDDPVSLHYTLYDLAGRKVLQNNIENMNANETVDLKALTPGAYYLHISTSDNQYVKAMNIIKL